MAAKRAVSRSVAIGAPVGGLNAKDSLAQMPETDAIVMDNFFPTPTGVKLRKGSTNFATGFPGWVETVIGYNSATSAKLFGISGGKLYDATAGGAIGAAVVSSLSNSRWQHVNIGTPGGHYVYACNGVDKPLLFDGTNWTAIDNLSTPAITGVTTTLLVNVTVHDKRVWFVEANSLRVWYLPVDSIGGAANSIDLSSLFNRGGYLMAMASWVIETVGSINQYAAFITSEGEVALYSGTDPSSAATWGLVGLFRVGRPVGRRCWTKVGEDVVIISADGLFPLSKALILDRTNAAAAVSDKITNLINTDVQSYSANFGWQCILHPLGNKLIVNVPQTESSVQYQYVMNTVNGSWCRFKGWNAACWELLGDKLYYGGSTVITQADTGTSDNGSAIFADVLPAYSYFELPGQQKRFTMARPVMQINGNVNLLIDLNLDFEKRDPSSPPELTLAAGSPWNTSPWNTSPWGGATQMQKDWETISGLGFAASLRMQVNASGVDMTWNATQFMFEPGGFL